MKNCKQSFKLDKSNAAIKPYLSVGFVCFARYCGKMYSRHLFFLQWITGVTGHTNERSLANYEKKSWTTADFLNHTLWRSGKQVQPTAILLAFYGKQADDEWRAVVDNRQFPRRRLSSDHHLPAQPNVSRAAVQRSTGRIDCRWLLNFGW